MSYYERHVFFCCNERDPSDPRGCCSAKGAAEMRDYAKQRVKALGLAGAGKVRINQAGCLDRCELGPCVVVYPDAVWYGGVTEADVPEIVDRHLVGGEVVDRLLIRAPRFHTPAGPDSPE